MEIIICVYICEEGGNCVGLKVQVFVLMEVILHLSIKEPLLKRFRERRMLGLQSNF